MSQHLKALVHTLRYEAQNTLSLEFRPAAGGTFPVFTAGSHINLHLPNGLERSYSLCNSCDEQDRYVVAVLRDRASRGGSQFVHDQLRVGTILTINTPLNNFPLVEDAAHSVLIAGGIGVTPLLCMAKRLMGIGRPFEVWLFASSRRNAAFLDVLHALGVPLLLHFDDEKGAPPDLQSLLETKVGEPSTHFYACGPTAMLDAFVAATTRLQIENVHIERFAAQTVAASEEAKRTYTVELARSGRLITIGPDKSLLDTLVAVGADINYSCCEGVCGSCRTIVLAGKPDHRDSILTPKERASNQAMFPCVSGSKSNLLRLDL